jgi:hypothetical protein
MCSETAKQHHGLALEQGAEQDDRITVFLHELFYGRHDGSPL